MNNIELQRGDCLELIKNVATESVDCILTDPPYLYLKHKLDRPFDEDALFAEFDRVVKPNGFVVIFGRGVSLARWVCKLDALGFKFKEEVIWDKVASSTPTTPIARKHEVAMLFAKGKGKVRRVYIPFEESCMGLPHSRVLARLRGAIQALRSPKHRDYIDEYLRTGVVQYNMVHAKGQEHTLKDIYDKPRAVSWLQMLFKGNLETSIMHASRSRFERVALHPTQKPVRLLERLLSLTTDEDAMVLDPFAGSGSTLVACRRTGRRALGFEIDEEYYHKALGYISASESWTDEDEAESELAV